MSKQTTGQEAINTMEDVTKFISYLIHDRELGMGFHPDTDIEQYINYGSNRQVFCIEESAFLQRSLERCFEVCAANNADIYEIGLNILEL